MRPVACVAVAHIAFAIHLTYFAAAAGWDLVPVAFATILMLCAEAIVPGDPSAVADVPIIATAAAEVITDGEVEVTTTRRAGGVKGATGTSGAVVGLIAAACASDLFAKFLGLAW